MRASLVAIALVLLFIGFHVNLINNLSDKTGLFFTLNQGNTWYSFEYFAYDKVVTISQDNPVTMWLGFLSLIMAFVPLPEEWRE